MLTDKSSDIFAVLTWGLRKYAWLVALFVLVIGGVVPAALLQVPDRFEASAQVGPTQQVRVPTVDVLPRIGETVFANVLESERVKAAAGLDAEAVLTPNTVELVAGQDNLVFTVVGRSSDPDTAKAIADTAAAVFADEFNTYSQATGPFAIGALATTPTVPVPKIAGLMAWGVGVLAGLAAGLGSVALLLLVRRPVIDTAGAEEATGAEVLGRVTLTDRRGAAHGMTALCHRILAEPTALLLLVGPKTTARHRQELAAELGRWLGRVRRVITVSVDGNASELGSASYLSLGQGESEQLVIVSDASPVDVATRPDRSLTLLIAQEGMPQHSLREHAAQYLGGRDSAVVLVRKPRFSLRRIRRSRSTARRPRSLFGASATKQSASSGDTSPMTTTGPHRDDDPSARGLP